MRDGRLGGMSREDCIIARLTDTQVEVRLSVSVRKALRDSMAKLAGEVRLAASCGELGESLQQRGLVRYEVLPGTRRAC